MAVAWFIPHCRLMRIKLCSIDKTNHVKTFRGGTVTAVATPFFTYKLLYTTGLAHINSNTYSTLSSYHSSELHANLFIYRPFDFG